MKETVAASLAALKADTETGTIAISASFATMNENIAAEKTKLEKTLINLHTNVNAVLEKLKTEAEASLSAFQSTIEADAAAIADAFARMKDGLALAVDEIGKKLSVLSRGAKGVLDTIRAHLETTASSIVKTIEDTSASAFQYVKESAEAICDRMGMDFGGLAKSAQTHGANIGIGLNNGLVSSFGSLVTSVRSVMQSISSLLGSLPKSAYIWGADICTLLANGIYSYAARTIDAARYLAQSIRNVLGFSLPKEGPLADADTYMPDFVELLANGIMDSRKKLMVSVGGLAESMNKALSGMAIPSMNTGQFALAGAAANNRTVNVGGIQVAVNGYRAQNDAELANMVARRLNEEVNRENAVWG